MGTLKLLRALAALLSALMGQDLYKAGQTSPDLRDLDQHLKRFHEMKEQPREEMKKTKEKKTSSGLLEDKCGWMWSG